ncbi:MAG: helix-turn-helix transcriptional regulator [Candidatus Paceibacterota bacterium]
MKKNVVNREYPQIVADIVQRIKMVRLETPKTQGDVAVYLGQSQSYVSKIETGKQPIAAAELKLLADFYKRPIRDFFD